jgi:hypothetical protein
MQVSQQGLHMTLKATITLTAGSQFHDTYFTLEGGVIVGPAGELRLVAALAPVSGHPLQFRIYAPRAWHEVDVSIVSEE